MLTHTWVEQYRDKPAGAAMALGLRAAVQFDFGDADAIPLAKGDDFADAQAPFSNCVLQFSAPNHPEASHALVWWRDQPDGSVHLMAAWKWRGDGRWRTAYPCEITRTEAGFHYETDARSESAGAIQTAHAMALNAFYILGCSNVQTEDHAAPAALNKKRAKSGKFPVLEYKTLVLKPGAPRVAGQSMGGTHASPRVHLRRGHVRRIQSGRRVWVQACVVGSTHGMILKDYKVCAEAS